MMPAGRTPRPHSASITGTDARGRRTRPVLAVKRLGPARNSLPAAQKQQWDLFVRELPWLAESDRAILEVACSLRARFVESEGVLHPSVLNLFKQVLATLGADPVNRNRVAILPIDDDDRTTSNGYFS